MESYFAKIKINSSYTSFAMPNNMIETSVIWLFHQDDNIRVQYINCFEEFNNILTYRFKCLDVEENFFETKIKNPPYGKITYIGNSIIEWRVSSLLEKNSYFNIKKNLYLCLTFVSILDDNSNWIIELFDSKNYYTISKSNTKQIIKNVQIIDVKPKYIIVNIRTAYGNIEKILHLNKGMIIDYVDIL